MDLFGLLLAKSLLGLIPKEEVGEDKYVKINDAFLVFFKQNSQTKTYIIGRDTK